MDAEGYAAALGVSVATLSKLKAFGLLVIGLALLFAHRCLSKHIGTPVMSAPLSKTRAAISARQQQASGGQKLRRRRPAVGDVLA